MLFTTRKKYDALMAENEKLQREHNSLWNLYEVTNVGYKELEKENTELRQRIKINTLEQAYPPNRVPIKKTPQSVIKRTEIKKAVVEEPVIPGNRVYIIGDTFGSSVMDKPFEAGGGAFSGAGASASWADDSDSCSKSYGGTDTSYDTNSSSSSSSSCSDSSSSSSSSPSSPD